MEHSKEWKRRGEVFKTARENRNLLQQDIAKLLGVKVQTICDYEKGRRRMSFDNIKILCKYLGVDIRVL